MSDERREIIFRKKSLDRIASPEQLTDYLRVTNPGIWLLLAAVILLLGGLFVWSMVGQLETVAEGTAIVTDGTAEILTAEPAKGHMQTGMTVRIAQEEFIISAVETDALEREIALAPVTVENGKYDVQIILESISPISFLFDR